MTGKAFRGSKPNHLSSGSGNYIDTTARERERARESGTSTAVETRQAPLAVYKYHN